jgi:hypothetical protein
LSIIVYKETQPNPVFNENDEEEEEEKPRKK